jgi:hypothetical protein
MDMLEDYLRAVSRLLPAAKRDDIIAELRDEILTRIEAKEEELGRGVTPDETEQLLREIGHPIVVAARYRDEPQYAVGPALYPFWSFAIRLAILIQLVISAVVFVSRVIGGGNIGQAFGDAIGSGITGVITLIGFATVAAWLIERNSVKIDYLTNWRVRDLRFLDFTAWDWNDMRDWFNAGGYPATSPSSAYANVKPVHHGQWHLRPPAASHAIGIIVGATIVLLWWTGAIGFGFTYVDPLAIPVLNFGALADIDWAAMKAMLFAPVAVYLAGVIMFGGLMLAWPRATRLHGLGDILRGGVTLGFSAWLWFVSPLAPIVSITSTPELNTKIDAILAGLPLDVPAIVTFAIIFSALGAVFRILRGAWAVLTGQRPDDEWHGAEGLHRA